MDSVFLLPRSWLPVVAAIQRYHPAIQTVFPDIPEQGYRDRHRQVGTPDTAVEQHIAADDEMLAGRIKQICPGE